MSIKELEKMNNFCSLKGVSHEIIKEYAELLHLNFSNEYTNYLKQYALASVNGHEITGIVNSKRLNVADVTMKNRKFNPEIPMNLYVIEELQIDDIVVWQDENGIIYQTVGISKPKKIFSSMVDYLKA